MEKHHFAYSDLKCTTGVVYTAFRQQAHIQVFLAYVQGCPAGLNTRAKTQRRKLQDSGTFLPQKTLKSSSGRRAAPDQGNRIWRLGVTSASAFSFREGLFHDTSQLQSISVYINWLNSMYINNLTIPMQTKNFPEVKFLIYSS